MVGGDGVSYGNMPAGGGTWRELMLREVGSGIDPAHVVFPGRIPYDLYVTMLQRSDAHVYLTYPFVASWSLREALATGCAIVATDCQTVREFITHNDNGLLTSFFDPPALADAVLELIENADLSDRLRHNARQYAEARLAMADYLRAYGALIERMTGMELPGPASAPPAKRSRSKRKS
jgi:glycosyltransferase involved in cell wall biosynthesis